MIIATSTDFFQIAFIIALVTIWGSFAVQRINITNRNLENLMKHFGVDWEGPVSHSPKGKAAKDLNK